MLYLVPFHVCDRILTWHLYFLILFWKKKLDLWKNCRNSTIFIYPPLKLPKCYNFTKFALALSNIFFWNCFSCRHNTFFSPINKYVFLENKDIFLQNHHIIIKTRKFFKFFRLSHCCPLYNRKKENKKPQSESRIRYKNVCMVSFI